MSLFGKGVLGSHCGRVLARGFVENALWLSSVGWFSHNH